MRIIFYFILLGIIFFGYKNCSEKWQCIVDGDVMYSKSNKGNLGGAGKGCSCSQIYQFEYKIWGQVDTYKLNKEFGCKF